MRASDRQPGRLEGFYLKFIIIKFVAIIICMGMLGGKEMGFRSLRFFGFFVSRRGDDRGGSVSGRVVRVSAHRCK